MSSSPIRALRVSASLAAYRLVHLFIKVGTQLRKRLASIQGQLNTEKRRTGMSQRNDTTRVPKKRAAQGKEKKKELSSKGKELANKVDELTTKNSELTELSDRVYRSIFIGRYCDIYAEVRSMSLSALGGWIMMFPDQFLDETDNKYIR
ncbi:Cohesin subunit SA-1 [Gracilariopsis chorda]|uniref:Cohesin subunit SA-1 n=1 Tax=Gracilariopsis chorda TaxID=448386 RepID=A0A2V3J109_9FLOR|nr:Cohesin subunit SA-1 [Gracilariopsis chorda]|eukprot:PXF48039.1 Cohesin subunit SA-1 [Gracilariopsis chorda]